MSYGPAVSPRVQVNPRPPRAWVVAAAAIAGLWVGLSAAAWSIAPPPRGMSAERDGARREQGEQRDRQAGPPTDDGGAAGARFAESAEPASAALGEEAEGAPEGSLPREAEGAAGLSSGSPDEAYGLVVERGRLAYLQCPGAEGADGRCPRDRELEARVWTILDELPGCPQAPQVEGTGDLRLHLRGDEPTTLRFRDWGEAPLPLGPLSACLGPPIEGLRTQLGARAVVVSFRFRLRRP